jgi:hypothetical protein
MMGFLVCLFDVGLGGCGGVVKSVTWIGLNLLVFFFAASCPTPDCAFATMCVTLRIVRSAQGAIREMRLYFKLTFLADYYHHQDESKKLRGRG